MGKIVFLCMLVLTSTGLFGQKYTKFIEGGKYEKAEKVCSKLEGEEQVACYSELAEAYFSSGDLQMAATFYPKTKNPGEGFLKIAEAYYGKEDYVKAVTFYGKTNDPNSGYLKVAEAYMKKKDFEKAADVYGKTNRPKEGYLKIGEACFGEEDYIKAAMFYEKTEDPDMGYQKIAEAYMEKKDYESAAEMYQKTDTPKKGYLKIAEVYLSRDSLEKAKDYYRKTKDNPTDYLIDTWVYNSLIRDFNYSSLLVNKDSKLIARLTEILRESQAALGKEMTIKIFESVHKKYEGKFLDLMDDQRNGKSVTQYDIELNMKIALYLNSLVVKLKNG